MPAGDRSASSSSPPFYQRFSSACRRYFVSHARILSRWGRVRRWRRSLLILLEQTPRCPVEVVLRAAVPPPAALTEESPREGDSDVGQRCIGV